VYVTPRAVRTLPAATDSGAQFDLGVTDSPAPDAIERPPSLTGVEHAASSAALAACITPSILRIIQSALDRARGRAHASVPVCDPGRRSAASCGYRYSEVGNRRAAEASRRAAEQGRWLA
jgi:hypothetical protein